MGVDPATSPGYPVEVKWRDRPVRAWVPAPLRDRPIHLSVAAVRAAERACSALRLADARLPDAWEPLARVLLRIEGLASSEIEGLNQSVESVMIATHTGAGGVAGWVADNLAVIDTALGAAHQSLTVERLHAWHRQLMRHGKLPEPMIGAFRPALGWVGGSTPMEAAYVPPPPSEIPRLIDDLISFDNDLRSDLDPVSHAAVVHAQFEAIHPYGDGNGRLGRVLISRILRRRGLAGRSTVPISMAIAHDPGGYLTGLRLFQQGRLDPWIKWFAGIVGHAAVTTNEIIDQVATRLARWEEAISDLRSDHSARRLLPLLAGHPVTHAGEVAEMLGVSERTARTTLQTLAEHGVLSPIDVPSTTPGRRRNWFAARQLLNLWQD